MKLTHKDKDFLEKLKELSDSKELTVELKNDGIKRLVLRKNYGDKIQEHFKMTRQGVRWRFHRIFSEAYIGAYETIYAVESLFNTELRPLALEIAKERLELRKKAQKMGNLGFCRREEGLKEAPAQGNKK